MRRPTVYISYWLPATAAVVADDLTGAADAAVGFLRVRLGAVVTWADPDFDARLLHETDVLAVDARTRALESAAAANITSTIVTMLFEAGVTTLYKKIDSTLRGHIGVEVRAALAAWRPGSLAIVAPAFPAMGRVTIDGRVRVHGVVLDRAAIATLLVDVGLRTRQIELSAVRSGGLAKTLTESRASGIDAVVCDAEIDEDLVAIADAGSYLGTQALWVGSGGLTHSLATTILPRRAASRTVLVPASGGVLIVIGSATEIAAEQAAHLGASGITRVDAPADVLEGADRAARTQLGDRIVKALGHGDVVVTLTSARRTDERQELAKQLAELMHPCVGIAGGLIVTGGETATQLLRVWGVTALRLVEEIEAGVPLAIGIGARSIAVVTKAGAFGDPGTLTRALLRLREMHVGDVR
jgi:D-threonate/D-erythronate kinase